MAHIIAVATLSASASDSAGMCLRFVFLPPYAPWSDAMLRGERYDAAECDGSAASDDEICCGDTWQIERCADPARIPAFSLSFHGPKMVWRNGCENAATSTRAETRVVTVSHTLPHALRSDPERSHRSQAVPSGPERSQAVPSGPKRSQAVPSGPERSRAVPSGPKRSQGQRSILNVTHHFPAADPHTNL